MGQLSRAARRSHNILQPVFPARTARIRVPTEGGESRRLPRKPDARGADVSARVSLDQRRDDGDREMTTQANRAGVAKLWLLNLVANAAALAAWYLWLLIPDAHGWQVAGSVLLAVCIIVLVLWLRAGTLAYFRVAALRESGAVWRAFRHSLRHLVALALWVIVLAVVEFCLWRLRSYAPQFGVWFWQKLPGWLRIGTPRQYMQWSDWKLWFLIWMVVPAVWLPIATTVAAAGFGQRIRHSLRVLKRPMYWLSFCVLMLIGAYVPYKLIWWIPAVADLRKQAWSMGLRFFAAYVIVSTAWIALVWMAGIRTEREDEITTTDLHG